MSDNQNSTSGCCCSGAADKIDTSAIDNPTAKNLRDLGSQNETT